MATIPAVAVAALRGAPLCFVVLLLFFAAFFSVVQIGIAGLVNERLNSHSGGPVSSPSFIDQSIGQFIFAELNTELEKKQWLLKWDQVKFPYLAQRP